LTTRATARTSSAGAVRIVVSPRSTRTSGTALSMIWPLSRPPTSGRSDTKLTTGQHGTRSSRIGTAAPGASCTLPRRRQERQPRRPLDPPTARRLGGRRPSARPLLLLVNTSRSAVLCTLLRVGRTPRGAAARWRGGVGLLFLPIAGNTPGPNLLEPFAQD